ncbi:RHS domain-containing protein [Pseudomonas reactans]|uniref:RHS repeat-associated core domain-containing protein n=1 Tax=Pseudomonas reactans TaxID=117680 RepID=UPI0015BDD26B|nr:RHS domain-containing protein [Pseudomonas reactans]
MVAPKNTFTEEDVIEGTAMLAKWLTTLTGDVVNWRAVITVGEMLPVAGSIFAATDAVGDIIGLARGNSEYRSDIFNWVGLGINLFAIVPIPGIGPARAVMRPALKAVRTSHKDGIAQALIVSIESALADVCPGDLEETLNKVQSTLQNILKDFAAKIVEVCKFLANLIRSVANGTVQDVALSVLFPGISLIVNAADYVKRTTGLGYSKEDLGFGVDKQKLIKMLEPVAVSIEQIGEIAGDKIKKIGMTTEPGSIAVIINALVLAVGKRKRAPNQANVSPARTNESRKQQPQNGNEASPAQHPARADANCRKQGTAGGTGCNISFAMGSETIVHTDFQLAGVFPLEWNRTYRSSLSAFDNSSFGARWITPFASRFDLNEDQLTYHATDGRSHSYPLPKVQGHHFDPIENVVIARVSKTQLTLLRGHESQEHYQRVGDQFRLTAIVLRGGARIALHYEHKHAGRAVLSDLVTYQNDTPHHHIHTHTDEHGRITALWLMYEGQPHRQLAGYDYDEHSNLIAARDEHTAQWDYQYQHHLITRYTDRTGRGMNLQWQGEGPDAKAVREWADDGSQDTRLKWDKNVRLTYMTDALGQETQHYYDILGYTYRIIYPDGNEEWLYRDDAKNITQHIHTDGSTDSYAYDDRGNLLQHTRPDGSCVHHAYDDQDQRFKTRDAEGGLWKYDYDQRGNIIETIDPLENTTQYSYNSDNLPVLITDANGGSKQLAYNSDGQLIRYTDCSGKVSQWDHDARGQLSRFTDAEGNVTSYEYSAGQLVRLIHPDKTEEHFERDAEGRLLSHTDALRQRTTWHYNDAGLIQQRQDANGGTLDYRWDRLGQLLELRNENNSTASFKYDPAGRLLKETGFDQQTTHYLYDHGSNQPTRRLDGDRVNEFEYDPLGRLIARHAGHKEGLEWQTETFAYDGNGNLLLAENAACKLQWFYDCAGNNTREHQYLRYLQEPHVSIWKHEYDALNQRIATTRPDGHRVSWLTYGSGHLLALKVDDTELLSYQRDNLHREIARDQGNGLQQRQAWTPNGQLREQALGKRGDDQRLVVRNYRHDAAGQLTRIDDTRRGALSYRYDPLGRLLTAQTISGQETFAFDPASNLLDPQTPRRPNQYGPSKLLDNLLRDYVGTHYTYDERGNLKERLHNGKKSYFTWDLYDRLIGYDDDRLTVNFAYDALGRRLFKLSKAKYHDRREAGPMWNKLERAKLDEQYGCGYTIYGWDGDVLAFESRNNNKTERLTHYFFEPGSFVPVAQAVEQRSIQLVAEPVYEGAYDINHDPVWQHKPKPVTFSALAWYQCDHLGTPMELTDEQGDIAWAGVYKAWGLAREQRSENAKRADVRNPLRFQGQYFDVETGLHYNRYRYYDPQVGRFIGKDPIGFSGGPNIFLYTANPTGWTDPLGLCSKRLNNALGGRTNDNLQAHHIIPEQVWARNESFLNKIGLSGKRDARENGVLMPDSPEKAKSMRRKFYHCGSHEIYSKKIEWELNKIEQKLDEGLIDKNQAFTAVNRLQIKEKLFLITPGKTPTRLL